MNAIPDRLALFADAHGHTTLIEQALKVLRQEQVEHIVLLGDLVDRSDQADSCALAMNGFRISGVFGNHEQEIIESLAIGDDLGMRPETIDLFMGLAPVIIIDNICFCHDSPPGVSHNPMEHFFSRDTALPATRYHIVFSGHTHFRAARDEYGPHDLGTGALPIHPHRHYSINPGAMTAGQFAIWDRPRNVIRFYNVHA